MSRYSDMIKNVTDLIAALSVEDKPSSDAVKEAIDYAFPSTELMARVYAAIIHLQLDNFKPTARDLAQKIAADFNLMLTKPYNDD